MTKLSKKTIWITGASSGIGEALVYELAPKSNRLIISSRRKDELARVKANCRVHQDSVYIVPLDLADIDKLGELAKDTIDRHGPIDVLVNNGGISQRSSVVETAFEVDRYMMYVNYLSAVRLTKAVLPGMIGRGSGHILITSSLVGKFGIPFRASYAASKHALHGYFDALAAETWQDHIFVTLFCAGYIKTNISLNAVKGDGTPQNKMDLNQARGRTPEAAARAMINAVEKNKREVYFGGKEVFGIYLKRYFPSLLNRLTRDMKTRHIN